jgi:hypothetical protein
MNEIDAFNFRKKCRSESRPDSNSPRQAVTTLPAEAAQPRAGRWLHENAHFQRDPREKRHQHPLKGPPVTPRSHSGTAPRSRPGGLVLGQARCLCGMVPARPRVSARRRPRFHFFGLRCTPGAAPVTANRRPRSRSGEAGLQSGCGESGVWRSPVTPRRKPRRFCRVSGARPVHVRCPRT